MDKLDEFEQELSDSLHRTGYKSVPNLEARIAEARKIAENTRKKDKKITIRMSSFDVFQMKAMAAKEGVPYQTLITSILHRVASGSLPLHG